MLLKFSQYIFDLFTLQNIEEVWTSVVKNANGKWEANGEEISHFNVQWGENEPVNTPGANCAFLSKSKDYKLQAGGCFGQKHAFCMSLPPKCPPGFTWVPAYGRGKSCFRITNIEEFHYSGSSHRDITKADLKCSKLNSRIVVPESTEDVLGLLNWLSNSNTFPSSYNEFMTGILGYSPAESPIYVLNSR